jgi:hypothetical protein
VTIKKVLGIEEDPLPVLAEVPHRVGDHTQVFVQCGPQRPLDMPIVAFGN